MREYGSEHPSIVVPDDYFQSFESYQRVVTYLRCGREALLYVALNLKSRLSKVGCLQPIILFPAYCCWSMSAPFVKAGWRVIYYRLNQDLTIDEDYLQSLLSECLPQAVLTMNYFGSADTSSAIRVIKEFDANISVIEDFSHCTFSFASIFNQNVDFYVSSLRKSIGIPDGAVVISKDALNEDLIEDSDSSFVSQRCQGQQLKNTYIFTKDPEEKSSFLSLLRNCEHQLDEFNSVHWISTEARTKLSLVNGEMIALSRRENMKHLWERIKGHICMVPGLEKSFDGAPFSLPILVDNRDVVQAQLAQKGLYTAALWPLAEEAKAVCKVSKQMNDRMLSVPIDQRYSWDDIEDIANILLTTI